MRFFQCFKKKTVEVPQKSVAPKLNPKDLTELELTNKIHQLGQQVEKAMKRAESFSEKGDLQKAIIELRKKRMYKMEQQKCIDFLDLILANEKATLTMNPIQNGGNV